MEEIYGCVNYIKIPYDTVMNMPVMTRKNWIRRHNYEQEKRSAEVENQANNGRISPEDINAYARLTQTTP